MYNMQHFPRRQGNANKEMFIFRHKVYEVGHLASIVDNICPIFSLHMFQVYRFHFFIRPAGKKIEFAF